MSTRGINRRQFLAGSGALAAGAVAASLGVTATPETAQAATVEAARPDAEAAREAAYAVAARVQDEGTVLLRNEGVLPLAAGSTVMPFGYAYLSPIYGQLSSGGSAKWSIDPVTPEQGLAAFMIDNAAADAMRAAGDPYALVEAEGTAAAGVAGSVLGGDCKIYEYDPAIYDGLAEAPEATGIVFLSRSGQEGQDQKHDAYEDGTPHYLAISQYERGTIAAAKRVCGSVVVVIVSSAPMEVADLTSGELAVDAIVHYGHPSERGFTRLSALLTGEVNPSGRTVDTWSADFTADPSYVCIGLHTYTNLPITSGSLTDGGDILRTFNEYQEGVYMGYRYYETAALVDPSFSYEGAVVFPFGYGLSYTTFSQTLDSVAPGEKDDELVVRVTVTNTGEAAGKDVAQLYFSAPYTELDAELGIEKPACNLAAFEKTDELAPGASQTLELTFSWEDLASYSYRHENPDGTVGCYVLEAGNYVVSLRANSHDVIAEQTLTRAETLWYDGSDAAHVRRSEREAQSRMELDGTVTVNESAQFTAATNRFQASSDYMSEQSSVLTRANWAGTHPTYVAEKELAPEFAEGHDLFVAFDPETDPTFGNVDGSLVYASEEPTSGADNGLVLSDLRGAYFDDPRWDQLLDQIDWDADRESIIQDFSGAAYITSAVPSLGMPATVDMDGANGLKVQGADNGYDMTKSCSFGFQPLMASTWNKALLYEVGGALGKEGLAHGINGWYSPGINLHRSFFSGRVFEYYSEDPALSGLLAASVVSGAGDQGLYCYLKHFALNETDTGRSKLICTWADEQTMRELYLRPFEIAVKNARMTIRYTTDDAGTVGERTMRASTAIMASQTGVGTQLGHTNYALLTEVLRGEWGFEGMVISDYWVWSGDNHRDLALRTGCDHYLCMSVPAMWSIMDYDSPTARAAMRQALHRIGYAVVNSSAMQGMMPGSRPVTATSPWQYAIWGVDAAVALLAAGGIALMVRRTRDEHEHPERYKRGKKAQAKLEARQREGK